MVSLRHIASVSLVILATLACERNPTVSQAGQDANPRVDRREPMSRPTAGERDVSPLALGPGGEGTLFDRVVERARGLAHSAYAARGPDLPAALARIDYEQYRAITFRPDAAIWRDETPFEVHLFHPGFLYYDPVRLHIVDDERLETLDFDPRWFTYEGPAAALADSAPFGFGFAGFRMHYPINHVSIKEEMAVFLGTSYFRLAGPGHVYGLSARGVAVDIALDRSEEFPVFREFWLVRPEPDAATATFYALLDGPSITGAYRFDLEPGASTVMRVDARLFARRNIAKLGVAPLSSMFLYGQNRMPAFDDFRPHVHDSDGLMMLTSAGEWIWRPLNNGPGLRVTSLRDRSPQGFGLAQRDREFDSYLDLEAQYHRRPSLWVEVGPGDWGRGGVELLTIPTQSEFNDNIAAYWVSDDPFLAGEERQYRYRLITFDARLEAQTLGQVDRMRIGRDALPGQRDAPPRSQRRFVIDFGGGDLSTITAARPVRAVLETSTGEVSAPIVQPLPGGRGWRAAFVLTPADDRSADMRLYLELDDRRLSETWSYVWYPERVE